MTEIASSPSPARIAWIGTGVMGAPMCGHLLRAGYTVSVHSRTRSSAEALIAAGAGWRDSPAAAAAEADVVMTMVAYPADVRSVVLGPGGVLETARPGSLLVDLTTSEPSLAVEIAAAAGRGGVDSLDAPVSGGDVGARQGTLVVMAGGSRQAFERAHPLLATFSRRVEHLGGPGSGQHAKAANQVAIAAGMIALCEALLYAQAAGLDLSALLDTIGGGAAGSWSMANYGPRMVGGDFQPGFKVELFAKDLGIALAEARRMNLALPGTALAEQLYLALTAQGRGALGTHSLVLALAELSGREWRAPT